MRFTPHNSADLNQMLSSLGLKNIDELFNDIPKDLKIKLPSILPSGCNELELVNHFKELADKNYLPSLSFLGGGAYHHFIPATVEAIKSRSEFYTSYTPYQPEISQGFLQAMWEFQSMICALLEMEIANSSMYDGATALAEAMFLACKHSNRKEVLVSKTVNPRYRAVLKTYAQATDLKIYELEIDNGNTSNADLVSKLDEKKACLIVQSPNYFGIIEDLGLYKEMVEKTGTLLIGTFTEALAFGLIKPPGAFGCELLAGEGQSLGIEPCFGGPGLGLFAAKASYARKIPGRLVGRTKDLVGQTGFVLTLQAREQHIRRAEATSNICSNHALNALQAAVYLSTLGKIGLSECAKLNYEMAHHLFSELISLKKIELKPVFPDLPFFNEFVIKLPSAIKKLKALEKKGIAAGLLLEPDYPELKDCILICVTELNSYTEIELLIKEFLR